MGQKKPEDDDPQFQFADDEFAEQTWFHRAKDAGVRYVRTFSEKSGLKVLPQMSLEEEHDPNAYRPGKHEDQAKAQQNAPLLPGAPIIQQRLQMPPQTNAARLATMRQKADAEAREKGRTVMKTAVKWLVIVSLLGFVGNRIYSAVSNAKVTGALRTLDGKKKGDKAGKSGKADKGAKKESGEADL